MNENSCGTDKEDSGKKTKTGEIRQIISSHNSEPLVCSSEIPQKSEKVFIVKSKQIDIYGDKWIFPASSEKCVEITSSELELLKVILDIDIRDGKMSGAETGYIKTAEALLKKLSEVK